MKTSDAFKRPEETVGKRKEESRRASRRKTPNPGDPDLPPNEHLDKHPDEVYGDTEIPGRHPNP